MKLVAQSSSLTVVPLKARLRPRNANNSNSADGTEMQDLSHKTKRSLEVSEKETTSLISNMALQEQPVC